VASRASFKDYYKTLGVKRTANEQELKQAYRRLARKYHPDVNPGDKAAEEQFKEVQEAYDVLRDKDKRRKYDQFGAAWRQGGATWQQAWDQARRNARGAGPQPGGAPGWDTSDSDFDFGDLLGNLFGERFRAGGRWASRPRAGEDIEQGVEISLEEAFHGGSRMFQIQVPNDSGGRSTERIEVRIPPGVPDGQRLRVAGKGHPGVGGGPRGDLHLKVRVRPHPQFERDGDDLTTDVPVPVWQAALGGEIEIRALTGSGSFRIQPETQNGQRIRLAGQGMPRFRQQGRGDLYIRLMVQIPSRLTAREKELFAELRRLRQDKARSATAV
jgi:DnaJ-class molecular chaperone